jgi:dUTP pyrophosphatase
MATFTNLQFEQPIYQLNIKVINQDTTLLEYYSNFSNHHHGDSGIDLLSNHELVMDSFKVGTLNFGIQCEMINLETERLVSYYLIPRSSISNTSYQMANSIGLIDAGYRGEIKAKVRNFNPLHQEYLPVGKYFQIVSPDLKPIRVNIVQELSQTTRGSDGFGSTNANLMQI